MKLHRTIATASAATVLLSSSLLVAPATATPSGPVPGVSFVPSPIVNGTFGTLHVNTPGEKTGKWGLILKTLDDTDIGSDRLTVQPQGFSGWHAHPGPVFVTVTQGTIEWYDAALCAAHVYTAGQSFIEPAYQPHNVRNPAPVGGAVAEFVAITIKPVGFVGPAFRLDRDEPSSC